MASGVFNLKQQLFALAQRAWSGQQKTNYVEYLVVAGGGGGGGSGGGAGGLLTGILPVSTGSAITVTVGGGGAVSVIGTNSVFGSITATGGGAANAGSGGSGSGAARNVPSTIGQGISGQGNAGGQGVDAALARHEHLRRHAHGAVLLLPAAKHRGWQKAQQQKQQEE